jgi:hypothetical protein
MPGIPPERERSLAVLDVCILQSRPRIVGESGMKLAGGRRHAATSAHWTVSNLPSLWQATVSSAPPTPRREMLVRTWCIVGAGIVGLSVAYELVSEGSSVVVLDDGSHRGRHDGAHFRPSLNALDDRYTKLERLLAPEQVRCGG